MFSFRNFMVSSLTFTSLNHFEFSFVHGDRKSENESEVAAESHPTLCDPMDCSLPRSSLQGIFQARVLDGLPFPSPGDLPDTGIEPRSPTL